MPMIAANGACAVTATSVTAGSPSRLPRRACSIACCGEGDWPFSSRVRWSSISSESCWLPRSSAGKAPSISRSASSALACFQSSDRRRP
ncbi:hypothetical protein G6F63_015319 [Rhizopus arrhizus]|nr:hypothetical protein G6F63_015319 [Rhizopus arrhizus]